MRKSIALVLILMLLVGLSIDGTMAFQQEQNSDVNVMTDGNVSIVQHEYERVVNADGSYEMITSPKYGKGFKLREFTQGKSLYPVVGSATFTNDYVYFDQLDPDHAAGGQKLYGKLRNIQDKFILVQNTGDTDVYVRTIVAFELGSVAAKNWTSIIQDGRNTERWKWTNIGAVEIDGNWYYCAYAVYKGNGASRHNNGAVPPGDYTYHCLGQIYMKSATTNEDCKAIDGNNNGTYDILVLSQAVQADRSKTAATLLNGAFGTVNAANIQTWFEGMENPGVLDNTRELLNTISDGIKEVVLGEA